MVRKWIHYDIRKLSRGRTPISSKTEIKSIEDYGKYLRSAIAGILSSSLDYNQTIPADVYCKQVDEMSLRLNKMRLVLVNRCAAIRLNENDGPHVVRITLLIVIDLGYDNLPDPPYSHQLSPTGYDSFKHL